MYTTDQYEGMLAETVTLQGAQRRRPSTPTSPGPSVPAPTRPWSSSTTCRAGTNGTGRRRASSPTTAIWRSRPISTPAPATARPTTWRPRSAREGGVPDDQAVGDIAGVHALPALAAQLQRQGRRLRHLLRRAPRLSGRVPRAGLRRRGGLLGRRRRGHDRSDLTPNRPVAPVDYTADLPCPVLGIFGDDDHSPTPEQVDVAGGGAARSTARTTSSTGTTARATASSTTTAPPTARSRRWTAGRRFWAYLERELNGLGLGFRVSRVQGSRVSGFRVPGFRD